MRVKLVLILPFLLTTSLWASHSPLLPRPQRVEYGAGAVPLKGLSIYVGSSPAPEDGFAARALSDCFSSHIGAAVPIVGGAPADKAISLVRTGPVAPLPVPDEKPGPESRESYRISIKVSGVEISAPSSAGLFYGVQTLCQMVEGDGETAVLPEAEIHDWPLMAYRGTMVDMSHGPLPTEEEIKRQIAFLAGWKCNQYYFYSEASIEMEGYSLVNPRGRFTRDQISRIVDYARERHVDVVPNLDLYGHLHDLFRIEKYSDAAVFPHGGEFDPASKKMQEIVRDWAAQLTGLFPSPFVHIGFDETWQIQRAARKAGATPARLFASQLKTVAGLFEERGKTVLAWADIIVEHPEIIPDMPPRLISVAWEYDTDDPEYKKRLAPLAAHNLPHFIQSGVSNWREIAPDYKLTIENIDTLLAAGRKSGAMGMSNSVWNDSSQTMMRMAWPAFAYGVIAPWQAGPIPFGDFLTEYARIMFPSAAAEAAAAIGKLNEAELALQAVLGHSTIHELWENPFQPAYLKKSAKNREQLRQARLLAEEAEECVHAALAKRADPALLESVLLGARMVDYAGLKFLTALEISERWQELQPGIPAADMWNEISSELSYQNHSRPLDMMDAITELGNDFRTAWLREYTPYRLETSLGRFRAEYEFWRSLQYRFRHFTRNYKDREPFPPLESLIPQQ